MKLYAILFFLLLGFSNLYAADEQVLSDWLYYLSSTDDLNQPYFLYSPKNDEELKYIESFNNSPFNPPQGNFIQFIRLTDSAIELSKMLLEPNYIDLITRDKIYAINTNLVAFDSIANILLRRRPIVNSFKWDKEKYPYPYRPDLCSAGTFSWDYLGLIQFRLILLLSASNDIRFEKQAEDLLKYIKAPISRDVDLVKMRSSEAKFLYTSKTEYFLPLAIEAYLKLCQERQ